MDWFELLIVPFLEGVVPLVLDLVFRLLTILFIAVATWALNWFKNVQIDEWVKAILIEGILSAQEKFWDAKGAEKFEFAKEYAIKRLNKWYIPVSLEDLDVKIDALVKDLKAEFGEHWYNNPVKEE